VPVTAAAWLRRCPGLAVIGKLQCLWEQPNNASNTSLIVMDLPFTVCPEAEQDFSSQ
jgi:hypothetical protein